MDDQSPVTAEDGSARRLLNPVTSTPSTVRSRDRRHDDHHYDERYKRRRGRGYYGGGYGYGGHGYGYGYHDHRRCLSGFGGYYSDYGYGGFGHRRSFFSGSHHLHYVPYFSYFGSFSFWNPYWYFPNVYLEVDYDGGSGTYSSEVTGIGALDTDVSPEDAEIFVDGRRVGTADDFDGFPDKLWLEEGTYDVAIYHPGYETIFRQYTIYPGQVIDVEDRMTRGESLHPDDHGPTTTARRDARIQQDRERARQADRRSAVRGEGERAASGRLLLDIWPSDAAVYLNGNFLGTAEEVSQLSAGLVVATGEHRLEVTRPGYQTREVTVAVGNEERQELVIELER